MKLPSHTLHVVFAVSVVCTAFWIVGLLWDRFFGDNIPVSATIAGAISAAVCLFAFRRGRLRLAPTQQFAELVREFIPRLIASPNDCRSSRQFSTAVAPTPHRSSNALSNTELLS